MKKFLKKMLISGGLAFALIAGAAPHFMAHGADLPVSTPEPQVQETIPGSCWVRVHTYQSYSAGSDLRGGVYVYAVKGPMKTEQILVRGAGEIPVPCDICPARICFGSLESEWMREPRCADRVMIGSRTFLNGGQEIWYAKTQ